MTIADFNYGTRFLLFVKFLCKFYRYFDPVEHKTTILPDLYAITFPFFPVLAQCLTQTVSFVIIKHDRRMIIALFRHCGETWQIFY